MHDIAKKKLFPQSLRLLAEEEMRILILFFIFYLFIFYLFFAFLRPALFSARLIL